MPTTRVTRLRELQLEQRAALDALLDEALIAHVGLSVDEHPLVVPTAFARDGDQLLVHGSTGSAWMRTAASSVPVCVTVTAVDGIIVARSAFESSMRYRSAVLFGQFRRLEPAQRAGALDLITDKLLPGRRGEVRAPTSKELQATLVLALAIRTWSLKVSDGWPEDPERDVAGDSWAGVVALRRVTGEPLPAPDLRAGVAVPDSVKRLGQRALPG